MEELRLKKITLRTQRASDLENFLVEVLGAEITYDGADSFLAEVGGVTFNVRPGTPIPDAFEFLVSSSFLADIRSRWEFYCFRHNAQFAPITHKSQFSCQDSEGRTWTVHSDEIPLNEYPSISVRNC